MAPNTRMPKRSLQFLNPVTIIPKIKYKVNEIMREYITMAFLCFSHNGRERGECFTMIRLKNDPFPVVGESFSTKESTFGSGVAELFNSMFSGCFSTSLIFKEV